jgi:hypothetical protein
MLTGRMMKSGDPIVAPMPTDSRVTNPYVGLAGALEEGLVNLALMDSGNMETSVIPEISAPTADNISTDPLKFKSKGLR